MKMNTDIQVKTFSQCRTSDFLKLKPTAQEHYRKKCTELIALGLLRTVHLQSLAMWADCYARYERLREEVDQEGYTFSTHNKFGDAVISANPKVKMMNDALKQATVIAIDFGLTPKSGRKLKDSEKQPKSKLEQLRESYNG